jgi:predicted TIM-barrel fold metal-dependent hydrolase
MIIDGHAHAGRAFSDPDRIGETLDRLGVDKVALCPTVKNNTQLRTPEGVSFPVIRAADKYFLANRLLRPLYGLLLRDQGDGNGLVHALARKHPRRILQFYWLDPREGGAIQRLEDALGDWPIRGIKLHQACNRFRNDALEMRRVAQLAGEKQLPIFIHPYSRREVRRLLDLARRYPETRFIVAHLLGLEIASPYAGELTNVYYDISGHDDVITPERLQLALETFGPARLVFGSDEPFLRCADSLARVRSLRIPEADKERILGQNLAALC